MKASELRIGNILKYHNQNVYVLLIDQNSAEFGYFKDSIGFCRFYADDECPQPIPLTDEWMVKFGFELLPWGFVIKGNEDKAVLIRHSYKPNFKLWLEVGNGLRTELKYVHQLQNLYYALTGTDLTIPVSEKPLSEGA